MCKIKKRCLGCDKLLLEIKRLEDFIASVIVESFGDPLEKIAEFLEEKKKETK